MSQPPKKTLIALAVTNSCHECKHLRHETESWEMPHIWWWECRANKGMENLKSFPFTNTRCRHFYQKTQPRGLQLIANFS